MRLDPRVAFRRLWRIVFLAPSLAFLLLLAAAGAASAADGLDLGGATDVMPVVPAVDPVSIVDKVVARLEPATDEAVRTVEAVSAEPAQATEKVAREARDSVEAVVRPIVRPVEPIPVPPVSVPPVILPDLPVVPDLPDVVDGPDRVVQPRRPDAREAAQADTQATPAGDLSSAITSAIAPDQPSSLVASRAHSPDRNLVLRPTQPVLPLRPSGAPGDAAVGGSGAGSGPWLGQGSVSHLGFPWRSVDRPTVPLSVPRGVTPQFVVPPG